MKDCVATPPDREAELDEWEPEAPFHSQRLYSVPYTLVPFQMGSSQWVLHVELLSIPLDDVMWV